MRFDINCFAVYNNNENSKVIGGGNDRCDFYHLTKLLDEVHEYE